MVPAFAYPPAPYHLIYGMVRDEMGNPLASTNAQIILQTSTGVQVSTWVVPGLQAGVNYRLKVPMDAGLTADLYKPNALYPTVPFRIKVQVGSTTSTPIEMSGSFASLGKPAQSTRLNLTLGTDSTGDGLPDAWKYAVIAALGGGLALGDITALGDADHDGFNNFSEFIAGTYAFDPKDNLSLKVIGFNGRNALLQFQAIKGRSYSLTASSDLHAWMPIQLRLVAAGADAPALDAYQSADDSVLSVEAIPPDGQPAPALFFKCQVQ